MKIIPIFAISFGWAYMATSYVGIFVGAKPLPLSEHWWILVPLTIAFVVSRFIRTEETK